MAKAAFFGFSFIFLSTLTPAQAADCTICCDEARTECFTVFCPDRKNLAFMCVKSGNSYSLTIKGLSEAEVKGLTEQLAPALKDSK